MIDVTVKNGVKVITFNTPRKKNAINKDDYIKVADELNSAAKDDSIKVVVLTGAGDIYSSGNDLSSLMRDASSTENVEDLLKNAIYNCMGNMTRAFYTFPKILIAVVNGPAIGITATTLALCDVIYCSKTAYFYTPFTKLGLCSEGCSSYTFPRILGTSKASEMLLMNHKMSAEEALRFNFVSEIYDPRDSAKVWKKIEELAELPLQSIKTTKALVKKYDLKVLEEVNNMEAKELIERFTSEEAMEAIINFNTKKHKL
ncbi:enoyl-CoA delta isomerase 2 [Culicoides brevitarsis]|uniref:enoyl-CoA delta isomerase 2 n=1 Tax=Culicoides brevitarsis TaxID=469753 RepID=UPI00307B6E9C